METAAAHLSPRAHWAHGALLSLLVLCLAAAAPRAALGEDEEHEGRAPTPIELTPGVEAAFQRQSYAPGNIASLVLFNRARGLTLQILHAGPEHHRTYGYNEMQGVPVSPVRRIGSSNGHRSVRVTIGHWPTGLYFARLRAADGRLGFAQFVLRPSRLGEHRVAVVMPTLTWAAYNIRPYPNGKPATWYADWDVHTTLLGRPNLNRGVPYMYRRYDRPFLNWLAWNSHGADFLADSDLYSARSSAVLARAYDLIVFPGHHEYVTTREYDIVRGYRDLGGNLAYLSANNFFWQILKRGRVMTRTKQWRDLGRPEASLVGDEYRANNRGHYGQWIVRDTEAAPWLYAGTGLTNGSRFGMGGIEADATAPSSPPSVHVLAEIPDVMGPGLTAQMTYYETPAGAKVFAAGAFTLAGSVFSQPVEGKMVENLWDHLSQP